MSTESVLPIISLMLVTLPVGALLIWLLPDAGKARAVALGTAAVDLCLALYMLWHFDADQAGFQFVERADWIPGLNVQYLVGVDGLSVLFAPLTALLFGAVTLASWNTVRSMPRLYYSLLLIMESMTLGVFFALDTLLFFLFWELTLVPIYFLLSLWGVGAHRRYAATKYTLFMLAGGVPLLFGFLVLAFNHAQQAGGLLPQDLSFDYLVLLGTALPPELEATVFFLLLLGFAVKTPLFPLHTWLPTLASEGPVAIAALIAGLKLGAYGLLRFVVPLAPAAAQEYQWLLAALGVTGILYGALAAMSQTNLRRMLAYSSISHVGLVVLGIATLSLQGIQGAVFQLLNFTLIAGGLFLVTGFLHQRTGSTDIINLGGVVRTMPRLTAFFLLFGLASLGMPGTSGFPAELLLLLSALQHHAGAGLAALAGVVLGAGYFMTLYRKAFLGPVTSPVVAECRDLRRREWLVLLVLVTLVLAAGLYPAAVLDLTRVAGEGWIAQLGH